MSLRHLMYFCDKRAECDPVIANSDFESRLAESKKIREVNTKRVNVYLKATKVNATLREQMYTNRKLIKASELESYRQRHICKNKERRAKLSAQ